MRGEGRALEEALEGAVSFLADEVRTIMEAVDATAEAVLRARHARTGKRSRGELERTVRSWLERPGNRIWGLGFVPDPAAYPSRGGLEWWQRSGPDGAVERLVVSLDPASVQYYDYTHAPWFANAREHGSNVTGPYVDAMGTNEHIVTFTRAVVDEGRFLGVAGADVLVATLQSALQPALVRIPKRIALVDPEGRVIATNDPQLLAGTVDLRRGGMTRTVPQTPWRFVVRSNPGRRNPPVIRPARGAGTRRTQRAARVP